MTPEMIAGARWQRNGRASWILTTRVKDGAAILAYVQVDTACRWTAHTKLGTHVGSELSLHAAKCAARRALRETLL